MFSEADANLKWAESRVELTAVPSALPQKKTRRREKQTGEEEEPKGVGCIVVVPYITNTQAVPPETKLAFHLPAAAPSLTLPARRSSRA